MITLVFLFIFSLACFLVSVTIDYDNIPKESIKVSYAIILFISLLSLTIYFSEPKPIDVYRNNTTLEITYKDSIAIDSVVVFKNK